MFDDEDLRPEGIVAATVKLWGDEMLVEVTKGGKILVWNYHIVPHTTQKFVSLKRKR